MDVPEMNATEEPVWDEKSVATRDRRLYRRYAVAVPARLSIAGKKHDCAITDLSLGGAGVIQGDPAWQGARCHLHCDDFYCDSGMRGKIVKADADAVHIAFDLNDEMESALTMFLVTSPATR